MKTAADYLNEPYCAEPTRRKLCQCGDLQCHNNPICHNCGGRFDIDPTTKTLKDLIGMKATFRQWGGLKASIKWFYAINERRMPVSTFAGELSFWSVQVEN